MRYCPHCQRLVGDNEPQTWHVLATTSSPAKS